MAREIYERQVGLLVRCLPYVAKEEVFALKGGTAINLFHRELPRLSVDIDLTYLPIKPRAESLREIEQALVRISGVIEANIDGARVRLIAGGGNAETRLLITGDNIEIKVETSPVMRGTVNPHEVRMVTEAVEEQFGFAEMQVVAFEDLFAGKLCAALDRQHPRDLFDVRLLLEHEGIPDELFRTFLVYVACSNRPPHEILAPNAIDISQAYTREFEGMSNQTVSLDELLETRKKLFEEIESRLDNTVSEFFLKLHDCEPDFSLIGHADAKNLPAIQWKLRNLERLKNDNPGKHRVLRECIENLKPAQVSFSPER
ncbi:nucleotidyl transferase AbiEii/AbiGii toxin family protein [Pseudovibrio ascidiaceicola]|uniref:nucleotidyl transferase AbiEii/AbiGii toxin family protein n=1 Tax=Pseudovibrio ascidiaceicola TaxID=285279 RepID=UPI003D3693A3